ncbi:hypothetical protein GCM10027064_16900 [Microbacterium petrolearium]
MSGAAAAERIASKGACSGSPREPSPTTTRTWAALAASSAARARSARSGTYSTDHTRAPIAAYTAAA